MMGGIIPGRSHGQSSALPCTISRRGFVFWLVVFIFILEALLRTGCAMRIFGLGNDGDDTF
jgi:hypothetical protein